MRYERTNRNDMRRASEYDGSMEMGMMGMMGMMKMMEMMDGSARTTHGGTIFVAV